MTNAIGSKRPPGAIVHRTAMWHEPRSCCWPPRVCPTTRSPLVWTSLAKSSPNGANVSTSNAWLASWSDREAGGPRLFPPEVIVTIKAMACELPATSGVPLSRWHAPDLARAAIEQGIVASISDTTIWRWLSVDAIRPWQYRSWVFPRDPNFAAKAGRALDLYHRCFEGEPLGEGDFVVCADEKTSIQARLRKHLTAPTAPAQTMRVEHEYQRGGALAYLAAWDAHRARLFGRCEPSTGIEPFAHLVEQLMSAEPYASADRVFWVVDNGSSHRGQASICRYTPRGSTRSRSTSRWCSARCSPPTTSAILPR